MTQENLHQSAAAEKRVAQLGLRLIEEAILTLLRSRPEGLGNSEIARQLNLESEIQGANRNYLTHSVVDGLRTKGKVARDETIKHRPTYTAVGRTKEPSRTK